MREYVKVTLIVAFAAVAIALVYVLLGIMDFSKEKPTKVGAVYSYSVKEREIYSQEYKGLSEACGLYGYDLIYKDEITTIDAAAEALEGLINDGCSIIFISQPKIISELLSITSKHKDVLFFVPDYEYMGGNIYSYGPKLYQARYITGILAGANSFTDNIGFIASCYDLEIVRQINAFALGVKKSAPEANVYVLNIGNNDEADGRNAVDTLIDDYNCDFLAYDGVYDSCMNQASLRHTFIIGYGLTSDSNYVATSIICNWDELFIKTFKAILNGSISEGRWYGMDDEIVKLSDPSFMLSPSAVSQASKELNKIINGQGVFSGDIKDNKGNVITSGSEALDDFSIRKSMDWYAEGVVIIDE